uniref:Uncharacterized protein n=1 Tax=Setaria italica TaxID=4555 RepID=K3Z143_SETIT
MLMSYVTENCKNHIIFDLLTTLRSPIFGTYPQFWVCNLKYH